GQTAGSTGRSLRLEAIRAKVDNAYLDGGIQYEAHVQNVGWQDWTADGGTAGTTGQGLRVEAVRFRLTGELASKYDVWYRAHAQQFGWMGWAKDGAAAGTSGVRGRMEAVQVLLLSKGSAAPTSGDQSVGFSYVEPTAIEYSLHCAGIGWQDSVRDGALAGTVGQGRQAEALRINLAGEGSNSISGQVNYRAHVQDAGWQGWVSNGQVAGTTGQSRRLEALQVTLSGQLAQFFDVYYQAQVADVGWLGWASDGQVSGSTGLGRAIEAVRVQLVLKGNEAPGSTWRPSVDQNTYLGYQTPGNYYKVGLHRVNVGGGGIFSYSSPVRIGNFASRQDCIEAFIGRALDYVGTTPYVWDYSCAPGVGVDCAGLVMQALYATGMDLGPHYTPYRHYYVPGNDHYANDMAGDGRFCLVRSGVPQRGDLVFKPGHVAIYLGGGRIVEAYSPAVGVRVCGLYFSPTVVRRPFA
ncbi:MAG: NlpC/P60 family protein, partial [Atopobiaceae bacterium]